MPATALVGQLLAAGLAVDFAAVTALPPYAPELNPVEAIWAYLKKHEIANFCAKSIDQVSDYARRRLKSMQRRPALITAFWQQAELAV
ncbi:MAG: transposase [Proteobacteria bacterium]|jgi:transposase|nr:transposase [Pseudomonadota bacterium]